MDGQPSAYRTDRSPAPRARHNRGRTTGLADGIVITPSHNPPEDGEFKYNPPHSGPADTDVTDWIETQANALLTHDLRGVKRLPFERAQRASTTHAYDYMDAYIGDLTSVVDLEILRG
jgi:phosphoglucomutase